MPGRTAESGGGYRFGFNGHEKIDEIAGRSGSRLDLGARIYNPLLGRMFSPDPREKEYPWQTTYAYYANSPVSIVDVNGEGGGTTGMPYQERIMAPDVEAQNSIYIPPTQSVVKPLRFVETVSAYKPNDIENIKENVNSIKEKDNAVQKYSVKALKFIVNSSVDVVNDLTVASTGFVLGTKYARNAEGHGVNPAEFTDACMGTTMNFLPGNLVKGAGKVGNIVKTTGKGLNKYNSYIKTMNNKGVSFNKDKVFSAQQNASRSLKANDASRKAINTGSQSLNVLDKVEKIKKHSDKK